MKILDAARGQFRIVVPFTKFEKTDDGRLMIEGIATSEALDGDNEVMDYASTKAAFADWPGNIREQHDPKKAVGRALEVVADDATKTIRVKSFVSKGAQDTQEKVLDGTLAAYSIAGSVRERKDEKVTKTDGSVIDAKRVFVKRISETSLVDSGCNPDSAIALVKADGDKLVAGDALAAEVPAPVDVRGTPDDIVAFGKALNEAGMTLQDAIGLVQKGKPKDNTKPVKKGMWVVADFAQALSNIASIARSAQYDLEDEDDASPVPASLRKWLESGIEIFKAMSAEEAAELLEELNERAGEAGVVAAAVQIGDLKKRLADPALTMAEFAKVAAEYLPAEDVAKITAATLPKAAEAIIAKASAKISGANKDRLQAAHDHLASMGAACGAKEAATATGDIAKSAPVLKLQADLAAALDDIKKLKAQPVGFVTLRTVSKEEDARGTPAAKSVAETPLADIELTKDDYIIVNGAVDWMASKINKAHKLARAQAAA